MLVIASFCRRQPLRMVPSSSACSAVQVPDRLSSTRLDGTRGMKRGSTALLVIVASTALERARWQSLPISRTLKQLLHLIVRWARRLRALDGVGASQEKPTELGVRANYRELIFRKHNFKHGFTRERWLSRLMSTAWREARLFYQKTTQDVIDTRDQFDCSESTGMTMYNFRYLGTVEETVAQPFQCVQCRTVLGKIKDCPCCQLLETRRAPPSPSSPSSAHIARAMQHLLITQEE